MIYGVPSVNSTGGIVVVLDGVVVAPGVEIITINSFTETNI